MKKTALLFFAALALRAFAAVGDTPAMLAQGALKAGDLEVRMLDGGFYRGKEGKLYPGARLLFSYTGQAKKFHRNVTVEIVEAAGGKKLASWKTFVSLKPGKTLQRRYGREGLGAWQRIEDAPALALQVAVSGKSSGPMALPAAEQPFGSGAEAGVAAMKPLDARPKAQKEER